MAAVTREARRLIAGATLAVVPVRHRRGRLVIAAALTAGCLPFGSPTSSAWASSCGAPDVTFTATSAVTLAPGVTALAGQATSAAGPVAVHLIRADLTQTTLRAVGPGATGAVDAGAAIAALSHSVAGINGDLYHVTPYGTSFAPDGPQADQGTLVKAGAGEADAFTVTQGVAEITTPHFEGTVTITEPVPATSSANLATTAPPTPAPTPKSSAAVHKPTTKKATRHKKKKRKKARRRHRRRHHRVAHPVRLPPGGIVVGPAPPVPPSPGSTPGPAPAAAPSAVVTLDGVNDVDGRTNAVLVTPAWGKAAPADEFPAGSVEVMSDGATVTAIRPASQIVKPGAGTVALVLSDAAARRVPWLAVGDLFAAQTALTSSRGPVSLAIGGNARLLGADVVDPSCSLGADTTRRPRVAIGTYAQGNAIVLAVAAGDTSSEPGLTLRETGSLMRALQADDALNLDGGHSSTLRERFSGSWHEVNNGAADEPWVANVLAVVA